MDQLEPLGPIIEQHAASLKQPGVISVRPGYKLENGWPSKQPAIVVTVSQQSSNVNLPSDVDGVSVDVRRATKSCAGWIQRSSIC